MIELLMNLKYLMIIKLVIFFQIYYFPIIIQEKFREKKGNKTF
jgi:preprotein translocase subunit YajC